MSRWANTDAPRGDDYDARWSAMAARGENPHGEADFVMQFAPRRVIDAGCGTGRVAIELGRRGVATVGVDLDQAMLDTARRNAPHQQWVLDDLATFDLGEPSSFDVVVMAGNVLIFVAPGTEAAVVARCGAHLVPGGRLITGFQLRSYTTAHLDADAGAVGLVLEARYATWDGAPFAGGDYVVSVHRLASGAPS